MKLFGIVLTKYKITMVVGWGTMLSFFGFIGIFVDLDPVTRFVGVTIGSAITAIGMVMNVRETDKQRNNDKTFTNPPYSEHE